MGPTKCHFWLKTGKSYYCILARAVGGEGDGHLCACQRSDSFIKPAVVLLLHKTKQTSSNLVGGRAATNRGMYTVRCWPFPAVQWCYFQLSGGVPLYPGNGL